MFCATAVRIDVGDIADPFEIELSMKMKISMWFESESEGLPG